MAGVSGDLLELGDDGSKARDGLQLEDEHRICQIQTPRMLGMDGSPTSRLRDRRDKFARIDRMQRRMHLRHEAKFLRGAGERDQRFDIAPSRRRSRPCAPRSPLLRQHRARRDTGDHFGLACLAE